MIFTKKLQQRQILRILLYFIQKNQCIRKISEFITINTPEYQIEFFQRPYILKQP